MGGEWEVHQNEHSRSGCRMHGQEAKWGEGEDGQATMEVATKASQLMSGSDNLDADA